MTLKNMNLWRLQCDNVLCWQ